MEKLPQSVLRRLQKTPSESEPHLDPNLLSAFAENTILAQERAPVVDHLAHCKDCRDTLAIAASAVEFPSQPRTLPGARFAPGPWFLWPALRWAALAAGVLIVASVGILRYGHNRQIAQVASSALPNQTSLSARSHPAPPVEQKPLQNDGADALKVPATARSTDLRNVPESGLGAGLGRDSAAAVPPASEESGTQTQLARNQPVPSLSGQGVNPDVVKAKNPVPSEPGATSLAPPPQRPQTVSPGNFRWAISGGVLRRSEDEGRTWQTVSPEAGSPKGFLAIAVNSFDVWVGGSAGSLYHSADAGTHWAAITPSADGTSLTGNVVGIQFSDTQHGKITTSHSEIWITSDAGQSWVKQ